MRSTWLWGDLNPVTSVLPGRGHTDLEGRRLGRRRQTSAWCVYKPRDAEDSQHHQKAGLRVEHSLLSVRREPALPAP